MLKPQLPHDADLVSRPPTAAQTSNTPQQRPSRDCGPVASPFCVHELNGSVRSVLVWAESPGQVAFLLRFCSSFW